METKIDNITVMHKRACVESMRFAQSIYNNLVEEGIVEPTSVTEAMEQYKYINVIKKYILSENNVDSVKFALAKNLVFFSDKRKHKIMGTQMLKELSERSLSSELQLALDGSSQDEK